MLRYIVTRSGNAILFGHTMSYFEMSRKHEVHSAGVCTLKWNEAKQSFEVNALGSSEAEKEIGAHARIGDSMAIEDVVNTLVTRVNIPSDTKEVAPEGFRA